MRYIPAFDGIRALAVLLVIGFHARVPGFTGGFVGVDIFFVLSGYLITSILLNEIQQTGSVRVGAFYLRRLRRLMPALLTLIALYLVVGHILQPQESHESNALIAALYLGDILPHFWHNGASVSHTWSLAVEEHYYLLWPLIVLFAARRFPAKLSTILLASYIAATLWRALFVLSGWQWEAVYFRFDMRLSGLILGSWLSVLVQQDGVSTKHEAKWIRPLIVLAVTVLIFGRWRNPISLLLGIPSVEWMTVLALMALSRDTPSEAREWLTTPVALYLGKISYGLYLYHYPVMLYLRTNFNWPVTLAIGLPISLAFAVLSYHTVEAWTRAKRAPDHSPARSPYRAAGSTHGSIDR